MAAERSEDPKPKPKHRPGFDSVSCWASMVSSEFVAKDTLRLLKFCFEGDKGIAQTKIEKAESFHELLEVVCDQRYGGDRTKTLGRMVFLLDHVGGHRKYGMRSTKLLQDEYKVTKPEKYREKDEPPIVQLYHCLAAIASRLSDDHEASIRNIYARMYGINPQASAMKDILSLFRYLVQRKKITVDDQRDFVETLFDVRAKGLLVYVKKFRLDNNLSLDDYPKLQKAESRASSRTTSFLSTSTATGIDDQDMPFNIEPPLSLEQTKQYVQNSPSPEDFTAYADLGGEVGSITSAATVVPRESHSRPQLPAIGAGLENSSTERTPLVPNNTEIPTERQKAGKGTRIFCTLLLVICTISVGVAAVSTYGVLNAINHECPESLVDYLVYEGSVIQLYTFSPYYVEDIDVIETLEHWENDHTAHLYLTADCNDALDTNTTTISDEFMDVSQIENLTAYYLMPGSLISYNICASTNAESKNGVRLEVFVLDNLKDIINFNPTDNRVYENYRVCAVDDREPCTCHNFTYAVKQPAYYSVRFVRNTGFSVVYNYTRTMKEVTIVSPPPHASHNCSVVKKGDKCSFLIPSYWPHEMNKQQCIIANIDTNEVEKSNYLHISVRSKCIATPKVASIVLLCSSVLIMAACIVLLLCFCFRKYTSKRV